MRTCFLAAAVLLLLAGCSATAGSNGASPPEREPVNATTPVEQGEPRVECLAVTDATIAGIQWGVDDRQTGLTVSRAVAIVNPAPGTSSWFVAAQITGPGMGDDTSGVWNTLQDPTTAEGDSIAFVSVDGIAAEFSNYVQPNGFSAALDGVDEVRNCLR